MRKDALVRIGWAAAVLFSSSRCAVSRQEQFDPGCSQGKPSWESEYFDKPEGQPDQIGRKDRRITHGSRKVARRDLGEYGASANVAVISSDIADLPKNFTPDAWYRVVFPRSGWVDVNAWKLEGDVANNSYKNIDIPVPDKTAEVCVSGGIVYTK